MPVLVVNPYIFFLEKRNKAISISPKCVMVLAAHAKPITSVKPIPVSPSLFTPVQIDWSPKLIKSAHPFGNGFPNTSKDKAGNNTKAPHVNITNNQGAQIPANSETALKP